MNNKKNPNERLLIFEKLTGIGAEHASKSLAAIVGQEVGITALENRILSPANLYQHIGGVEESFTMVVFRIDNVMNGFAIVAFPEPEGDKFVKLIRLMHAEKSDNIPNVEPGNKQPDYSKESIIKETSNIIVGSFLSAMHKRVKVNLIQSVPHIATDMIKSMLDEIIAEISQVSENILVFETELAIRPNDIRGRFFLLSDIESANEILQNRV
ncbi:MAG: chemotaxis protein CheC [Parcubacteria group bacterium]|jgi:chemotaxis protein CheC